MAASITNAQEDASQLKMHTGALTSYIQMQIGMKVMGRPCELRTARDVIASLLLDYINNGGYHKTTIHRNIKK